MLTNLLEAFDGSGVVIVSLLAITAIAVVWVVVRLGRRNR